MTPEDLKAAEAKLTEVDTEVAALDQSIRDYIDKAREFNNARRDAASKRTTLLAGVDAIRRSVAEHVTEMRRQHAEKAKAEAEAKAKEPQPPNALEVLAAEVRSLREQLAVKG